MENYLKRNVKTIYLRKDIIINQDVGDRCPWTLE